jgi:hypothetical protein
VTIDVVDFERQQRAASDFGSEGEGAAGTAEELVDDC